MDMGLGSDGALAQMGERLICNQEVTGSIPVGSTSAPGWVAESPEVKSGGFAIQQGWFLRDLRQEVRR